MLGLLCRDDFQVHEFFYLLRPCLFFIFQYVSLGKGVFVSFFVGTSLDDNFLFRSDSSLICLKIILFLFDILQ